MSYIEAAADGHGGMTWGDLLCWAGPRKMVVITATGVVSRNGREGVQRQIPVEQTAARVKTNHVFYCICSGKEYRCIVFVCTYLERRYFSGNFNPN